MTFSVIIATRDRCQDLQAACSQILALRPGPEEVIICADGCHDDTANMLRSCFPGFHLLVNECPRGSVYSRDRMLRAAGGDIVVCLDDDSYPIQGDFLRRLGLVFEDHPEAAAVAFPELRDGNQYSALDKTDRCPGHYVSAYANCAAAMRRAFYLERPGFQDFFEHMYEEPDYALQCYASGAAVWFEPSLSVRHREASRNRSRMHRHHLNARNELWSVWLRCPWPWWPLVSAYRAARQMVYAFTVGPGWAACEPRWWGMALHGLPRCYRARRPVGWRIYWRWLRLARNPIYRVADLRRQFRSLSETGAGNGDTV